MKDTLVIRWLHCFPVDMLYVHRASHFSVFTDEYDKGNAQGEEQLGLSYSLPFSILCSVGSYIPVL